VHPLNKLPYAKLDSKAANVKDGVLFLTYSSLIASSEKGRSRLQQLVQWCGPEFDGLIVFDEVLYTYLLYSCLLLMVDGSGFMIVMKI
jgi:hypothetical protein